MRFTLAFGFLGLILAGLAVRLAGHASAGWWWLVGAETYLAICFLAIAAVYGLRTAGISVEGKCVRSTPLVLSRVILLPYVAFGALALYIGRWFDSEGLLNPVAQGLYIGRLPFPADQAQVRDAGVQAVLNLCWEFRRHSGIDREPGLETAQVSILDGAAPTDEQFQTAVRIVAEWRAAGRCVLIHCAQGHGRTATITAAVLVRLGLAPGVEEALSEVRAARHFAYPSREQKAALIRYLGSRNHDA